MRHNQQSTSFFAQSWANRSLGILLGAFIGSATVEAGTTLGHWLFVQDNVKDNQIVPIDGGPTGSIPDTLRLNKGTSPSHLSFDSRRYVTLDPNTRDKYLPTTKFTIAAWVRMKATPDWGGFVGAIRDNGSQEEGWLLGSRKSNFSLALRTEGSSSLTYLSSQTEIELNQWYHLVGVYDGKLMQLYVNGKLDSTSTDQQGAIVYPPAFEYVIGAYKDSNESYALSGDIHEVKLVSDVLGAEAILDSYQEKKDRFPVAIKPPPPLRLKSGPFVKWLGPKAIRLDWETYEAVPTDIEIQLPNGESRKRISDQKTHTHHAEFSQLTKDSEHFYQISYTDSKGLKQQTKRYLFDTTFYYEPDQAPSGDNPFDSFQGHDSVRKTVAGILQNEGLDRGYCFVIGATTGQLAYEVAMQSDMQVVILEEDSNLIHQLRQRFSKTGLYGSKVSVHKTALDGARFPFGPYLANLVLSESFYFDGRLPGPDAREAHRLARPCGGAVYLGQLDNRNRSEKQVVREWFGKAGLKGLSNGTHELTRDWTIYRRPALEGAGEWTHQYGNPDNSSCSQDELVKGEVGVQWWGEPGPRPMPDRGPRNPAPVSSNGHLYIQGDRVLFGLDAYNGAMLWTLFNPELRRANVARDSSNMVAASDALYIAQGGDCWALDTKSGERRMRFSVNSDPQNGSHDWGYLSIVEHLLIGSSVLAESRYIGDEGEWYENFSNSDTARVVSDSLFGRDRRTGEQRWEYREGKIINSTITIADNTIYLIESLNPALSERPHSRIPVVELTETQLVALDLSSGRPLWSKEFDFSQCQFMLYMAHSGDKLVVTGSDKDKVFHSYVFAAKTQPSQISPEPNTIIPGGTLIWNEKHKEDKGHHSGHLQHPVLIDDVFYSDQRAFNLNTGETLRTDLPERRGCGTMSASKGALFFRHYYHAMWDLESDKRTQFEGIRSGCWLSLIPSGGLLLAPESSAGCSCSNSIQTTVAYLPAGSDPQ